MDYTFGQAKRLLTNAAQSNRGVSVDVKINNAIQALAGLTGWEFMRRLVRISSAAPVFTLPQGSAALVRVCINGRPASLHGTDYQFLHSGPGDLSRPPAGFRPLHLGSDVADLGYLPYSTPIDFPMVLAATSPYVTVTDGAGNLHPQPKITVTGFDVKGTPVTREIEVTQGDVVGAPEETAYDDVTFAHITNVVLGDASDQYITLFGKTPTGLEVRLAEYHPSIKVPKFRCYQVTGGFHGPFDILAEVRFDPLECINDSDVIPISSLEPIRHMMLYDACLEINELATAQQYLQQAVSWIQQMKVTDDTIQTPVVSNTFFEGSVGELAEEYKNL